MNILAFDTAMKSCAVACVSVPANRSAMVLAVERRAMSRGQAEELAPMVGRVMKMAALSFDDLDRIALTIGPGTFTGIRTGLATARGIGLAAGKPVLGVGTLQALACDVCTTSDPELPENESSPIAIALDARRGQVYFQIFDARGAPLTEPVACAPQIAMSSLPSGDVRLAGTGAGLLVGGGAKQRPDLKIVALPDETGPDPLSIALAAARISRPGAPPSPLYLRPPDAKPQLHVSLARR